MSIEHFSAKGLLADTGEGITGDELQLAARNHGIPLEALRYELTPPGLHYVLVHYDIPATNASTWQLTVDGCVEQPLSFGLTALRAMGRETVRVTLECAGNGRAGLHPRPISQPWLMEAVGTAEWTGAPLANLLRAAGLREDAVDVVFTGADHGFERGIEQDYQRGLTVAEALDAGALIAWEMNGMPLPPQHGYPLRLIVPGWYGMASVKWLRSIEVIDHEFAGYQNATAYRFRQESDEACCRGDPDRAARAADPARSPGLHEPPPVRCRGPRHAAGPRLVGMGTDRAGRGQRRRWSQLAGRETRCREQRPRVARLRVRLGRASGRARADGPRIRRERPGAADRGAVEPRRLREQLGPADHRAGALITRVPLNTSYGVLGRRIDHSQASSTAYVRIVRTVSHAPSELTANP